MLQSNILSGIPSDEEIAALVAESRKTKDCDQDDSVSVSDGSTIVESPHSEDWPMPDTVFFRTADGTRQWEESVELLSTHSERFAQMFRYERTKGKEDDVDPCALMQGIKRVPHTPGCYVLDKAIRKEDFDALLMGVRPKLGRSIPVDRLDAMLLLATKWGFDDIRRFGIDALSRNPHRDPVQRIVVARGAGVPQWLRAPYVVLCTRLAPLGERDVVALGPRSTMAVCQTRERVLKRRLGLVRGPAPSMLMGKWTIWHPGCWGVLVDGWYAALLGDRYASCGLGPKEALTAAIASYGRELCTSCAFLLQDWLELEKDERIAEEWLKRLLGKDPEAWGREDA
ncbi:hypothetical protein FRB99_008658 [Tulasnella sp. 403]|nr:hypothetical protein FRB99_008658 [Tulasnella sp. 403]